MVKRAELVRDDPYQLLSRPMPHSAEAERAILGAIVLDNALMISAITSGLQAHDFYIRAHQFVWEAMVELFAKGAEINPILLGQQLVKDGVIEQTGGVAFISELTYGLPHFTNVAAYVKVVKDKSALRQLVKVANKITSDALAEEEEAEVVLAQSEQMIMFLVSETLRKNKKARPRDYVKVEDDIPEMIRAMQEANQGVSRHLSTGIAELDAKLEGGGLRPQGLYIVAARPKTGKTSFVLDICVRAAQMYKRMQAGRSVGIISMEMQRLALAMRALSAYAKVPFVDMTRAGFRGVEYEVAMASVEPLFRGLPLWITDAVYTIDEMWHVNNRLVYGPAQAGLIAVDYMQLAEVRRAYEKKSSTEESRYAIVSQVSREIKHMAQEFDIPFIAVSSINRVSSREGRRAELHDLRESGQIEFDAEAVAFLENPDWKPGMKDAEYEALNRLKVWDVNINLAAQRNGPTGLIPTKFLREFMQFMTVREYENYMNAGRRQDMPDFPDVPSL